MISPRWNSLTTGIPVFSGFCWKRVCLRSFEEVWGSFFVNEIQKLSRLYQLLYHVLSFYLSFRSDARIAISLVSFPNTNLGGKRQPCFASDYNLQLMDRKKNEKGLFWQICIRLPADFVLCVRLCCERLKKLKPLWIYYYWKLVGS